MIISHKHQFIFMKPRKVAGTSVSLALEKYCDENDVVTPIEDLGENLDEDNYFHWPRNSRGFYDHSSPNHIRKRIGEGLWDKYFKISIIRNPWDMVVSRWFFTKTKNTNPEYFIERSNPLKQLKNQFLRREFTWSRIIEEAGCGMEELIMRNSLDDFCLKDDFKSFVKNFPTLWTNDQFYFEGNERHHFYFLRFENIEQDYLDLCDILGITYSELPRAKTKTREEDCYSSLYNFKTKDIVKERFARQIKEFGYNFSSFISKAS